MSARYKRVRRLLCCAAAFVVLYIEIAGSVATRAALFGVNGLAAPSIAYRSPFIERFLASLGEGNSSGPIMPILYLTSPDGGATINVLDSGCPAAKPGGMYCPTYLTELLGHLFSPPRLWHPVGIRNFSVVVDCGYGGILLHDTTALKVHLLDAARATVTTVVLQTINVLRPDKHIAGVGGLANVATTNLSVPAQAATYHHLLRRDFPFELGPFEEVALDATAPATWAATQLSTGERFVLFGTDGLYRGTPRLHGNYAHYNWSLPSDAMAFATSTAYYEAPYSIDSYAWVRCLLGLGIAFNLGLNMAVAGVIVVNMWHHQRQVWIPDFYPSVQRRIQLRALLLLGATISNDCWHVFEYCLQKGNAREGWNSGFVLEDMVRSDGLTYLLSLAVTLADVLKTRLGLDVLVAIYVVCLSCRLQLLQTCGWCLAETNAFLAANYMACIVSEPDKPMSLWMYHDNAVTPLCLLVTELTWFIVAVSLALVYAISSKVVDVAPPAFARWTRVEPMVTVHVTPKRRPALKEPRAHGRALPPWHRPASVGVVCAGAHSESGRFEQSDAQLLAETHGIVAPFDEDPEARTFVSASGVWLLGYLVLKSTYLVEIHAYPWLWLNVTCRRDLFRIYCFRIGLRGRTSADMELLRCADIAPTDLVTDISLQPLQWTHRRQ
ncbi:hypothetical protein ACHHYP_06438 [Achlya hypogyna]|uniref:Transmembrane protein n=1 Tax=Achlya hypogyna TaxID=1202772 RepID=A0A1V9YU20_ACHHY|nr:hypothetical protein ACHHYP_06438 [Achlya hypogyna]